MIHERTVFILGAGASMPYGFPSGSDLVAEAVGSTSQALANLLTAENITHDQLQDFKASLLASQRMSIDAFLEHRPDYMAIGKLLIAYYLSRHETVTDLRRPPHAEFAWYAYLFNDLMHCSSFAEFANNKVAFITYNYDRSFEQAMYDHLSHSFNKASNDVIGLMEQIPIIHLHGSLGSLNPSSPNFRPYTNSLTHSSLTTAASSIRIIHENEPTSTDFSNAIGLMHRATRIVFLGFGNHPVNVARLRFADIEYTAMLLGTAHRIRQGDLVRIMARFGKHHLQAENRPIHDLLGHISNYIAR